MTDTTEVRTISKTGGEKGSKIERFDLIPAGPLRELAAHYGKGSEKYEDRNWERGYDWSLSYAAMQRHAWQFWNGEDIDPETGSKHIIAVAWHALALAQFMDQHPSFDNRVGVKSPKENGMATPRLRYHAADITEAAKKLADETVNPKHALTGYLQR